MSILVPGRVGRTHAYPRKWVRNQSDVMALFGAPCEEIYLPGEPAAGNITGKVAGNVLSPVTSPLYQQALTSLPGDPLGAGFDWGTADSFDAATDTVHEYAGISFAMLVPWRLTSTANIDLTTKQLIGKRDAAAPNYGYELLLYSDTVTTQLAGAAGAQVREFAWAPNTSIHYVLFGVSIGGNELFIYSDIGAATAVGGAIGSPAAGTLFSIGAGRTTTHDVTLGPVVIWSGAAAEHVIANRATSLSAWWAL